MKLFLGVSDFVLPTNDICFICYIVLLKTIRIDIRNSFIPFVLPNVSVRALQHKP